MTEKNYTYIKIGDKKILTEIYFTMINSTWVKVSNFFIQIMSNSISKKVFITEQSMPFYAEITVTN